MPNSQDRLAALEEEIAALRTRLAALEEQMSSFTRGGTTGALFQARGAALPSDREPPTAQTGPMQGTLSYSGDLQLGERPLRFRQTLAVQSLFEAAPDLLGQIFAALASPHRVIILRTLCERPCTAQQLQEVLEMGSAGQLYHHLKELLTAGLITQRERSSAYTIEPAKVIPVCAALLVAFSLASFPLGRWPDAPPSPDQEDDLA
jgi:DNA-binding transcriptional ArsR family regulator